MCSPSVRAEASTASSSAATLGLQPEQAGAGEALGQRLGPGLGHHPAGGQADVGPASAGRPRRRPAAAATTIPDTPARAPSGNRARTRSRSSAPDVGGGQDDQREIGVGVLGPVGAGVGDVVVGQELQPAADLGHQLVDGRSEGGRLGQAGERRDGGEEVADDHGRHGRGALGGEEAGDRGPDHVGPARGRRAPGRRWTGRRRPRRRPARRRRRWPIPPAPGARAASPGAWPGPGRSARGGG